MIRFKQFMEVVKKPKLVVVYAGRFQPFHPGHKESYDNLVKKFGKDNVYLATSNKTNSGKSPFDFKEKKKIITGMFKDIPPAKIVKTDQPFRPAEILSKFPKDTVFVAAVGKKDAERLAVGKYFSKYTDSSNTGYEEAGYFFVIPRNKKVVLSGTEVREMFKTMLIGVAFKKVYGVLNLKIMEIIGRKLNE